MTTTTRYHKHLVTILGLALLSASAGCVDKPLDTQPEPENLQDEEVDDLRYMKRLLDAQDSNTMYLDLSDDRQYDFVVKRLSASDKTNSSAPELLRRLVEVRRRHGAEKQRQAAPKVRPKAELASDHFISSYQVDPSTSIFEATAFSTIRGGSDYSFVDVRTYSTKYRLLAASFAESYVAGKQLVARAFGDEPQGSYIVIVDSIQYVRAGNEEYVSYSRVATTNMNASAHSPTPDVGDKVVVSIGGDDSGGTQLNWPDPALAPAGSDDNVTICLWRTGSDCDYRYPNNSSFVPMPFKGQIDFSSALTGFSGSSGKTFAKISDDTDGGVMTNNDFTSQLTPLLNNSFATIGYSWEVGDGTVREQSSNQDGARFSNPDGSFIPFAQRENVNFYVQITANPVDGANQEVVGLISSVASYMGTDRLAPAPQVNIFYGCLAEGTQIRMDNRSLVAIEDITEGAAVIADDSGMAFDVADLSVGIEEKPMVRIRDDHGRELLLTDSHPVVTADRGILWASELATGDMVMTESGPSELLYVGRELYRGKVHNLRLDKGADPAATVDQGSTLYANGFLVGDLAMQRAYEFKNADAERTAVLERLPPAWHADYRHSQARTAGKTAR